MTTAVTNQPLKNQPLNQQNPTKKQSLFELDILRIVAMALILFEHARPYIGWDPRWKWLLPNLGGIGLTLFFFLSGFLLRRSLYGRTTAFDAIFCLKRRFIRIMPLYWLSIVAFILVFHVAQIFQPTNFSPLLPTFLIHATGLQLFFLPHVSAIFTIWYMGALIPYYLLFAVTAKCKPVKYIVVNALILSVLYALKLACQQRGITFLDARLLLHYPTFFLGICYSKLDLNLAWVKKYKWVLWSVFTVLMLVFLQWRGSAGIDYSDRQIVLANFVYYTYCVLGAISFIGFSFVVAPSARRYTAMVATLSASSYAVYLFHRPVYSLFYDVVVKYISPSPVFRTIMFPVLTVVLIWIAHNIAQLDARLIKPKFTKLLSHTASDAI